MVLKAQSGAFGLTVLGRKRLPDIDGHEQIWGFVGQGRRCRTAPRNRSPPW
jgi:hypothetical protein